MPSATTSSVPSSEMAKESSFDLRLRPTSLSPAPLMKRCCAPLSLAALPLDTRPLLLRGREFAELGERRLVVRLARQARPKRLHGLTVMAGLRHGEGQVQPGERILRIDLQCPAKRGDRLLPAQKLTQGHADIVVDVGEVRVELAGQAELFHGPLVLSLGQEAQCPPIVEGESHRTPQEGLAHPLLDLRAVAACQRLPRLLDCRDVRLRQVVVRHAPVRIRSLRRLQDTRQELDGLLRLAAVVVVQARLELVVAQQVADQLEQPHQWAFFPIFFEGWVRTMNMLRAWRRTSSGMFLSPATIFRSLLPRRDRN